MYMIWGETDPQPRLDAWDKRSGLVHWEVLEGSVGKGGGKGDRDGEHMWTQGCFISMYDKIHYNKKKKKKKKKNRCVIPGVLYSCKSCGKKGSATSLYLIFEILIVIKSLL